MKWETHAQRETHTHCTWKSWLVPNWKLLYKIKPIGAKFPDKALWVKVLPKCHYVCFVLTIYYLARDLSLLMVYIPSETPLEKASFFSVDGCPLKLASGLGIGSAYFRRTTRKESKILDKPTSENTRNMTAKWIHWSYTESFIMRY